MAKKEQNPVQFYIFDSVGEEHEDRNDTACRIIRRDETSPNELLEFGPAFVIEFGDLFQMRAFSSELRPSYQVD